MPGSMPGHVSKGYIIRELEQSLNDGSGRRQEFLTRLEKRDASGKFHETVLDILSDPTLFKLRSADKRHLRDDWFDQTGSYWPHLQPIDAVVRHGFIMAISQASSAGAHLPIDIYWICGPSTFELVSCVSPQQLTLIVLTPGVAVSDRLPEGYEGWIAVDPIYAVRATRRGPGEIQVRLDDDFVEFVQPKAEP